MPESTYRVIHIAGLMLVFLGLGGVLLHARGAQGLSTRLAMAAHGIGLLLMLVAGFGLLAKRGYHWPWPGWLFGKLLAWLLIGALPALHKRGVVPAPIGWVVAVAIGATAAWLAVVRPA